MSHKMNALVLKNINGLDGFALSRVKRPAPQPGEVLVKIQACALNHRDVWIASGLYANIATPIILGSDGSGTVIRAGDNVSPDWLNKPVIINPSLNWSDNPAVQSSDFKILGLPDNGTQAEFVCVPVENICPKPDHLSWEEAAALPLAGLTGYRALFSQGKLQPGETVLITGIGGGVASLMLKMAVAANADVFVTSGDGAKLERATKLGARGGVNYTGSSWPENLKNMLEGKLIDLIVDSAGGKDFSRLISLVRPGGKIVFFGATRGNPENINLRQLFWRQITLQGTTMGTPQEFQQMVEFFKKKNVKPVIDTVFELKDYRSAYSRMIEGKQFGKIVMKVG